MIRSKAVISDGKGNYKVDTIQIGECADNEVLVKIAAAGICHTDWDSIQTWNKNFIVGHEGAGYVHSVGKHVTKVSVGDKVILNWAIPCGHCFQCNEGNVHICETNSPVCGCGLEGHAKIESSTHNDQPIERSFHLGAMSEYAMVKQEAVVKLTHDIPFAAASIVGCGVMTGWGSVVNAANVKAGSTVCVIGCGGVGLNVIQGAKNSGAAKIIAIDIAQNRIEQAKEFGATHGVISEKDDLDFVKVKEQVLALNCGRGADYAFECTAIPALGSAPLTLIRSAGTAVQVSGIEQRIDFDCELFEWDKIYINPLYGMCNPERDFPRVLDLYEQGKLKLEELVTKTYALEDIAQGFDDLLNGRIAKGVVLMDELNNADKVEG
ncbi:alcohol dehydrogenase catalytic domain-containing protein [Paraglaciecola aquimarina]|uniref:Alcohol dehydrogenase catalytic domain-containing protein n=1 Tax=Paraglaciecola algarum TaxID=3050085 RepID=A0ABS9D9J9_9ALTE|nr:alcohol dehydrogenase catalytic domain-containing protein [Paraglaciecola sp. G1-23]MCF2949625.1 alcohol dehydrogenase catalytic domain-containing protein [Paraglaciecola sp. G1-23]